MTRPMMPCAAILSAMLAVAACQYSPPSSVALYGAETPGGDGPPRPVPARASNMADGTVYLELASADGAVFRGPLSRVALPAVQSAVSSRLIAGGGVNLEGTVASDAGESLACRVALMDSVRGVDGGGTGSCASPSRRFDLRF